MNSIKVIHVVGSSSCKKNCLMLLKNKLKGKCLDFATIPIDTIAQSEKTDEAIIHWIDSKVHQAEIILSINLPPTLSKKWLKKTYPESFFKHYIWEIHSDSVLEQEIIKERSISLVFGKLLKVAKEACALGINPENPFIKHTAMKQGMQFECGEIKGIEELIKEVCDQQITHSNVYYSNSFVCEDGLKQVEREKSADMLSSLITF